MNSLEKFILVSVYLNDSRLCYPKLRNLVLIARTENLVDVDVSPPDMKNNFVPNPAIFASIKNLEKRDYINIYGSDIINKEIVLTEKGSKKAGKMVNSDDKWIREAVSVVEVWKNAHPYTVMYYLFTNFRYLYPRDRVPIILYRVPDQCLMR